MAALASRCCLTSLTRAVELSFAESGKGFEYLHGLSHCLSSFARYQHLAALGRKLLTAVNNLGVKMLYSSPVDYNIRVRANPGGLGKQKAYLRYFEVLGSKYVLQEGVQRLLPKSIY